MVIRLVYLSALFIHPPFITSIYTIKPLGNCCCVVVRTAFLPDNSPCNFFKWEGNAPNMLNVLLYCLGLAGSSLHYKYNTKFIFASIWSHDSQSTRQWTDGKHLPCIYMFISCGSTCTSTVICMYLFNGAFGIWLVTQPNVVWTNSNAVPTWSAGASSVSRQQQWQTDCNFWQYNLSATHLTLQSFLFCAFLVPLWLMCLTRYMLPLRQEQLTASLTMPQVPRMTQSNRIRVCVWGGGCACVCVRAQKKHPWSSLLLFFLTSLCQRRRKVQQLGWANALAAVLLRKNKTRGGEMGIWEGDSLQSATMVYVPKAEISA